MSVPHWNGWGVESPQRRFQPAEMAQLAAEEVPRLKLKWAFGFPRANFAFAQPTVMGGRVFVGSAGGKVYSLDANTGCTYWEFDAGAPVRSAITIGPDKDGWLAYFSDRGGNVHAVDVVRGEALWTTHVADHPAAMLTGSPMLAGTTLFVPIASARKSPPPTRISLLRLPRQRRRVASINGKDAVEELHDRRGAPGAHDERRWHPVEGTLGRRSVVLPDLRLDEGHDLCDYGRQLLGTADRHLRCHSGVQRRFRENGLVASGNVGRRV